MFDFLLKGRKVWVVDYRTGVEVCYSARQAYLTSLKILRESDLSQTKSHYLWYKNLEKEYEAKLEKAYYSGKTQYSLDGYLRVYKKEII